MKKLKFWPRKLPMEQKKKVCPDCGEDITYEVKDNGACRLVCSENKEHWSSDWGEVTWEGRRISKTNPEDFKDQ